MLRTNPKRSALYMLSVVIVLVLLLGQTLSALAAPAPHTSASGSAVQVNNDTGHSQHVQPTPGRHPAPEGLSAQDWASIQDQIAAGLYRSYVDGNGGYHAANPALGWQIHYGVDGMMRLTSRDGATGAWQWGLTLTGYGYGDLKPVGRPQTLAAHGRRLTYRWDETLDEWWVNDASGLEQGFTLNSPPTGRAHGIPLQLRTAVSGDLRAVRQGAGVAFVDSGETTILAYAQVQAWDAAGQTLPTHLVLGPGSVTLAVDDTRAVYPLTIDPYVQQAYLKASNTGASDQFGAAVAVSGDTVVVGAPREHGAAGAAYVFVRSGGAWSQQAYLKASNTGAGDGFGSSVAISGDTVVVGAPGEDSQATGVNGKQSDNTAPSAGAGYVFVRSGTIWSQQAYLKASNTGASDGFGSSVAISGGTVVVGAPGESSQATGVNGDQGNNLALEAGAAYVFVRNSTTWSQQIYLKASNAEARDQFGAAVAISGDAVVVGAPYEDSDATGVNGDQSSTGSPDAGAGYVFVRNSTTWSEQAYLKASNTGVLDHFGWSVAISGDTLVVGAPNQDGYSGAGYVFVRNGGSWSQQAYLKASNTGAGDQFGWSVAISGDRVVAGAPYESSHATGINGDPTDNSSAWSGAGYVFVRSGTVWSQQAYLKASNTGAGDQFGWSVALSGDTVAVGALYEASSAAGVNGDQSDNTAPQAGAVYVFATTYNVSTATTGAGTVVLDPPGGTYGYGTVVTATAKANTGSIFGGWSGDLSGATNPAALTMNGNKHITAAFSLKRETTGVSVNPAAGGSVSGGGTVNYGDSVTLIAKANTGYTFANWSEGGTTVSTHSQYIFTATGNRTLVAHFSLNRYSVSTATQGAGSGTVSLDPPGGTYGYGTVVTATAKADTGSIFGGWSGDCTGVGACVLTIDGNKRITSTFSLKRYSVSTATTGAGSGTVSLDPPGGAYLQGTVVTATATAKVGSVFSGWSGACTGVGVCMLTVDGNKRVIAAFGLNRNLYLPAVSKIGNAGL